MSDQSPPVSRVMRARGMRRGPYMPDPPTHIRLDLDEQGARILHGVCRDALPGFYGAANYRLQQVVDALADSLPEASA